jgi:NDP-sugar pyrophosphorylase family protein
MILAAGLGTRLKPFTDHHPKALAVVNNKTILQRNIEYLQKVGIYEVVVNVHHFASQIIDILETNKGFGSTIHISDEMSEVLETGGGLLFAKEFLNTTHEPLVLMNVDILTDLNLQDMLDFHASQKNVLATLGVSKRNSSRCFLFDDEMRLCGWRNNNTQEEKISIQEENYTEFSFSGIHIIDPRIFSVIKQTGKFSMVDVYLSLAKEETILGFNHTGTRLMDVGKAESITEAEMYFL